MKKFKLFLALCLIFFLIGCSSNEEKVAIDNNTFNSVLTENGFAVVDSSSSYQTESYIISASTGKYDDIEIQFIKYTDSTSAEKVLEGHIETFNLRKSTGASTINKKGKNFHKYILISNNYYMLSARVEDTLIFCNTPLKNKDLIEKILETIKY